MLIVAKEFRHIARNKGVLMISLVMPALLMGLVGSAFSSDIKHIPIGVVDEDMTPMSISLTTRLQTIDTFHVTYNLLNKEQAENLIRDGKIRAAILVPDGFESDLKTGRSIVYLYVDGSDPVVAGIVGPTLEAVLLSFSPSIKIGIASDILYNPGLHYLGFLAPSIVGLIVQFLPTFLTSISLAGEKEKGTIEQLVVTPIGGLEILLGKMATYSLIGFFQANLALGIATTVFGLQVRGSVILVAAFLFIFTLASVSVGTLSSVFAKSQIQAMQQIIPFIYISIFLSGVFYPLDSMPVTLRPITYFIPMTYMNHALRAIITKGAGLEVVLQDFVALSIYALAVMALAVTMFKKKLE
jgi:ABC-2 type transport system permease protein